MSIPKDHHYIPRMLLKRFTDKEGNLYFYDKRHPDKGVRKRAPKNLFYTRHFYTQVAEDGTQDAAVETEFLAVLESEASPVIEKIINAARRGCPPNLSLNEKDIWSKFFFIQFSRVPDTLGRATDEVRQRVLAEIDLAGQSRPLNDLELSVQNSPETMERHLINGRIQNLQMSPSCEVTEFLAKMRIVVAVIRKLKPKRSFIIGSKPVVRLSFSEGSHVADPNAEVWLPLSRDMAISFCPGECDKVVSANDRHIRAINKSIFQQSKVIAGCSRELIEFVRGSAN